jgi:hypothetical protein
MSEVLWLVADWWWNCLDCYFHKRNLSIRDLSLFKIGRCSLS